MTLFLRQCEGHLEQGRTLAVPAVLFYKHSL